ncbi:MAG: amino acid ABC transporter substrate-binding protein [Phreatobacter sp.]|nr:amino acid ABC transporter substrate-binding protein [Phreatobacter sp.]
MNRREISKGLAALLMAGSAAATSRAQFASILKVGITSAGQPASGVNSQTGAPEGFAVEIMQAVAADAGLVPEFHPMPFGELQSSLLDKRIDAVAGSFGITPERQRVVDFTHSYGSYRDVLIVRASNPNAYRSVADLKGMKIATSRGSSYVRPLEEAGADLSLSASTAESIAKLEAGNIDGIIENELQVNFRLRARGRTDFRVVDSYQPILIGHLAFAVRKGDADLLLKLDRSLSKLEAGGSVAEIKKKWGLG